MTRKHKTTERELLVRQSQPVPMQVVCSLVYHQLNRDIGNIGVDRGYSTSLNATALALSQVADIYYIEQGRLLRVPSEELAGGSFEDSGATYRAASGRVFKSLSMRRIDVMEAMLVLKKARLAIEGAKSRAKSH
jgi:hypothetical protein